MLTSPIEILRHIREEAEFLTQATAGMTVDGFIDNSVLKRACVRAIEVIGEAAKKLPEDFKSAHSDIERKKMAGMRDRPIHDYFGVDYFIVFDVARNKAPNLAIQIGAVLSREGRELGDDLDI